MQRDARADPHRRPARRLMAGLAALWLALMAFGPSAQANPAYTVRNVQVTKTAASGSAAQDAAVREARDRALNQLFRRLVPPSYHQSLPRLPASKVDAMVAGTEVQQEQITATAYTATLAISFTPAAVRQTLQSSGIPFTDRVSPPLIVVPVFERAGALQLWETPNPWDSAWRARIGADGLLNTVIADGKPAEQLILSADQAIAGDDGRLQALAQSYGARGAVVAHGVFRIDPANGQPVLEGRLTGFGAAPPGPFSRTFTGPAGMPGGADEAAAELSTTAAAALSAMLADAWRNQNVATATASASSGEILVSVPLSHLGDYAAMYRQLQEIPVIDRFSLARLTSAEAVFRMSLRGSTAEAQQTFRQYGMNLAQNQDGWILRSGG